MAEKKYCRLDDYWPKLLGMLKAGDGVAAREELLFHMDSGDIKLYNGLFWYVDKWLLGRFSTVRLSRDEIKGRLEMRYVSKLRMMRYLEVIQQESQIVYWMPTLLPRILHDLPGELDRLESARVASDESLAPAMA